MKYVAKHLRNVREKDLKRKLYLDCLVATRVPGLNKSEGRLHAGPQVLRCALGAGGVTRAKREGDHASPAGSWRLLSGFYRADRILARWPQFPMRPIRRNQGWCDDPESPLYNRLVATPFARSHEILWRDDHVYDVIIVLDYNIFPRRKQRGSAIFIHCARDGFGPTEGCVALRSDDLRRLSPRLSRKTTLTIR